MFVSLISCRAQSHRLLKHLLLQLHTWKESSICANTVFIIHACLTLCLSQDNPPWLICWAFPLSCLLPLLELTSSLTKPPTRHVCTDDICSSTCGTGSERESLPAYSLLLREAFIHTKMSWCLDKCNGFSIILVHLVYNEYRITEHVLLWTLKSIIQLSIEAALVGRNRGLVPCLPNACSVFLEL